MNSKDLYITVPLALIGFSIICIGIIIVRKLSYLKKLTPESHQFGPTIWHDFFPEIAETLGKIHFDEYVSIVLREIEKLVRKIRIFFSRIDRASSELIQELRTASKNGKEQEIAPVEPLPAEPAPLEHNPNIEVRPRKIDHDMGELKSQEQQYIIQIAQHPKDPALYAALGEIYVKMGNFHDAKNSFEAAINLDPADKALKYRLSFIERKLGENKDSL